MTPHEKVSKLLGNADKAAHYAMGRVAGLVLVRELYDAEMLVAELKTILAEYNWATANVKAYLESDEWSKPCTTGN